MTDEYGSDQSFPADGLARIQMRLREELQRLIDEDFRCDHETEATDEPGHQFPPRPSPR